MPHIPADAHVPWHEENQEVLRNGRNAYESVQHAEHPPA